MLIQTDPFRDLDTLFSRFAGRQTNTAGTAGVMPMDAFRRGSDVWVHIDLPGVKADSLEITVERNVLTIAAERSWQRQEGGCARDRAHCRYSSGQKNQRSDSTVPPAGAYTRGG